MERVETVVAGAGVIGLSIARALARRGREVLVLEREAGIGQGTSSRNSEVIHAGLYYRPGSLRARLCVEGRQALYQYCKSRGIPHQCCGKLVVATAKSEEDALQFLFDQARANGVEEIELVDAPWLNVREPALHATKALFSPTTGIVDGHALMLALQGDAEEAGAHIQCLAPVIGGQVRESSIQISVGGHAPMEIETALLVNAAGLRAWELSHNIGGLAPQRIPQRYLAKGTYFAMNGPAPFTHLVYPLPQQSGLGIHLTFDLGGGVRFGPDTEWVEEIDYSVDPARADAFYDAIRSYWPSLPDHALVPAYAGIRPKTEGPGEVQGDFVIQGPRDTGHHAYAALYGIDSPGLTASLAIGAYVAALIP